MFRLIALLFVIYAIAGGANATPSGGAVPIAEIPYRIDYQGWITVEVTVDGQGPYDFIVDTGSTLTLIFENLTKKQPVTLTDEPLKKIVGLTAVERLPAYLVGDISVGGQTLPDHKTVVIKDWREPRITPHGLLGLDFLSKYVVVFDPDARLIKLYAPSGDQPGAHEQWRSVEIKRNDFGFEQGDLYTVSAKIQQGRATLIIDLGASGTMINKPAARTMRSGIYISATSLYNTGTRIADIFDRTETAQPLLLNKLRIGKTTWRNVIVVVHDAPIFKELGVSRRAYGLLGADLLKDRHFAIDFEGRRMFIGPTRGNEPRI